MVYDLLLFVKHCSDIEKGAGEFHPKQMVKINFLFFHNENI